MMNLTKNRVAVLNNIAKEAEKLAQECKERVAPEMGSGYCFENGKACCAFGQVLARALPSMRVKETLTGNDEGLERALRTDFSDDDMPADVSEAIDAIANANDNGSDETKTHAQRQKLLVKPLKDAAKVFRKWAAGELQQDE